MDFFRNKIVSYLTMEISRSNWLWKKKLSYEFKNYSVPDNVCVCTYRDFGPATGIRLDHAKSRRFSISVFHQFFYPALNFYIISFSRLAFSRIRPSIGLHCSVRIVLCYSLPYSQRFRPTRYNFSLDIQRFSSFSFFRYRCTCCVRLSVFERSKCTLYVSFVKKWRKKFNIACVSDRLCWPLTVGAVCEVTVRRIVSRRIVYNIYTYIYLYISYWYDCKRNWYMARWSVGGWKTRDTFITIRTRSRVRISINIVAIYKRSAVLRLTKTRSRWPWYWIHVCAWIYVWVCGAFTDVYVRACMRACVRTCLCVSLYTILTVPVHHVHDAVWSANVNSDCNTLHFISLLL